MKNLTFLFLVAFCFMAHAALAQRTPAPRLDVHFGVGVLPTFLKDRTKTIVPPVMLSADYFVKPHLSLGLFAGHSVSDTRPATSSDGEVLRCRNRFSAVGLRAAIHTTHYNRWSAYGGMNIGYAHNYITVEEGNIDYMVKHKRFKPHSGNILLTAFVGGRYSLTPDLGVFGELGFGISCLTMGVSRRF